VALLLLAVGCDKTDASSGDFGLPLDMTVTLNGCNSLNACLDNCRNNDACAACGRAATPLAVTLYNAFDACRLAYCHTQPMGDGGIACNDSDVDPASMVPFRPSCVACTHASATLQSMMCKPKTDACLADKP
jgi:hypothetical protein